MAWFFHPTFYMYVYITTQKTPDAAFPCLKTGARISAWKITDDEDPGDEVN